jgi:DNA-binding transcriptional ArsR family regulator
MPTGSAATYRAAIPIFAALGDEQRLALVRRLSVHGPASLSRLCDGAGMTRQGVSKHLHVLASAGLVRRTQRGRESIWTLAPARMAAAQRALETISAEWDASLARLRAYVEHD